MLFAAAANSALNWMRHAHSRPVGDFDFAIVPNGREIVFDAPGAGGHDLFLLDLTTNKGRCIAATPDYETRPAVSPDGKWLAYSAGRPGEREDQLYLRSIDGSVVRTLTSGDANICWPSFYPSGERILFVRDTDYRWGGLAANWQEQGSLWSVRTDGSDLRPVLPKLKHVRSPRVSRDGKWIAYVKDALYVTRADGTGAPRTLAGGHAQTPDFSPDGTNIVFFSGQYRTTMCLQTVSISGGKPKPIAGGPTEALRPRYSPDGKSILFLVETWSGNKTDVHYSLWRVALKGGPAVQVATEDMLQN